MRGFERNARLAGQGGSASQGGLYKRQFPYRRRISTIYGGVLQFLIFLSFLAALSAATFIRNSFWSNGVALWSDAAGKSSRKARPHANLGMTYDILGDMKMAKEEYQRAISLEPDYLAPYGPLAVIYGKDGDLDMAMHIFQQLLTTQLALDHKVHAGMGMVYMLKGQLGLAEAEFKEALRLNPDYPTAHYNLAKVYERLGMEDSAIRHYRRYEELSSLE